MTYTLINCTALAFDLVRRPHGSTAAAILITALTATPDHLTAITTRDDRPTSGTSGENARCTLPSIEDAAARTTLGDLTTLDRLVDAEVLAANAAASALRPDTRAEVVRTVTDALTRAWVAPPGASDTPVPAWVRALPADMDLGPDTDRLYRFLYQVASATPADRTRWREATRAATAQDTMARSWAHSMHEATWAVHLSRRTHAHTLTQLLTVQAYQVGGFTLHDTYTGVWNAISGTTSALLVSDLIPATAHRSLTQALHHADHPTRPGRRISDK